MKRENMNFDIGGSDMKLIFIRHGQGIHNTDIPDRLNIEHPRLTDKGIEQVRNLTSQFIFNDEDIFVVSPTIRAIETTNILTSHMSTPHKYISPLVGPRMFPFPVNPHLFATRCDMSYSLEHIVSQHSDYYLLNNDDLDLWFNGINTMNKDKFTLLARGMIEWIRNKGSNRAFIITHDGTITCYREVLGEQGLTRADFLGEAGWHETWMNGENQ
jgi:hypothetical protein